MIERSDAMDGVQRVLRAVRGGRGGALFVIGEAGLGKSTILSATTDMAYDDGFTVARAAGHAMETSLPFGVVTELLASIGGHDVLVAPSTGERAPVDARTSQLYSALRWFQRRDAGPVLLAVDDLHWADADSLALLSFLCRRLGSLDVALVATLRPWPRAAEEAASALAYDGQGSIVRLAPLSEAAAGRLLSELSGRETPETERRAAWASCGGNPLLLGQVALALANGELAIDELRDGELRVGDELLLSRFAGLPPEGMRFVQAASVFGVRFRPDLVRRLSDVDDRDATVVLDALGRNGLVHEARRGEVEFAHPLFRQALYDDLGAPARARLHAAAFSLLVERGLETEAAEHALEAGLVGDTDAIAVVGRVGRAALRTGAVATAIELLTVAVEFAGAAAAPDLLLAHAEALGAGGDADGAVAACERILERPGLSRMERARALRLSARALVYLGSYEAAATRFERAADWASDDEPEFAVETLVAHSAEARFFLGPGHAVPVAARARALAAARCGEATRRRADAAWAFCAMEAGDAGGIELAAAAVRGVEADPLAVAADVSSSLGVLITSAFVAKYTERLDDAERFQRAALGAAERAGVAEEEAFVAVTLVETLVRRLRLDGALELVDRAAGLADLVPVSKPFADVARALVLLLAGDVEQCRACAREVQPVLTSMGLWSGSLWLSLIEAWQLTADGRLDEACAVYSTMEEVTTRVGLGEPGVVPWGGRAVTAYAAVGRERDARRVIQWLEDCSARLPTRFPRIAATTGKALLAEAAGDEASADALFGEAMALHDGVDLPLERFHTLLDYGRFLRRTGEARRARPLLTSALDLAEAGDARWLAGHAYDELKVAGGRRRRTLDAPGALTPQEQRVADLAASGATNGEIARQLWVSVRTVETHLQRVYAKLGVRSRRELVGRLGGRGREVGGGDRTP